MSVLRRRARRVAANALLVSASALVGLVVLEVAIRWLRPQPLAAIARSARLGWVHKPNTTIVYEREEFRVPVRFSSAGLRDREYPFAKPPGTYRIAWLGDSFVEALQVPLDSCAAKRLEAQLNASATDERRYEVINFGVSGYGGCQQLLLLEELALRFEPDLVLAQFYANDLDDDRRSAVCALGAGGALQVAPPPVLSWTEKRLSAMKSFLLQHSALWTFVTTRQPRVVHLAPKRAPPAAPEPSAAAERSAGPESPAAPAGGCPGRHETLEWRLTLREAPVDAMTAAALQGEIWRRMQDAAGTRGAGFLAVLGVSKTQIEPEVYDATLTREGCDPAAHAVDLLAARIESEAAARGVRLVSLVPAFQAGRAVEPLHFRVDGHWNAAGHRVAAEALCEALRGRGMLGSTRP